jgi:hypothetical protein
MALKHILLGCLALPFLLLFFSFFTLFFTLYLVTLIGPLYHFIRLRQEAAFLLQDGLLSRHPDMGVFPTGRGDMVYRWTEGRGRGEGGDMPE